MFHTTQEKKQEYWNHFLTLKSSFWPVGFTSTRLEKIKEKIFQDEDFWDDVVMRHGGEKISPEQMKQQNKPVYDHSMGNMAGMLFQTMRQLKILK